MVRATVLAAIVGASIAAGAAYAVSRPALVDTIATWLGWPERPVVATAPTEDFPVCTTMASLGADVEGLDPDFAAGKKALAAGKWDAAITALKYASLRDPRNADIQNYIGYAYSRLRELGPAMQHFQQALTLNRRHRGAHEHLGELYLALGEPARAEEQLAALEDICLIPCEETGELKRAIAAYNKTASR
jgi:tetratricopeptide (TPR) repeat protein